MIVYAGKQFWNDFNNWDEALFQDANRPRDDNMFMIKSWIQARKQDLRTANSWIAAQGTFYGAKLQGWQQYLTDIDGNWLFNTAYMKDTYTESDVSSIWIVKAKDLSSVILWKPYVNATWWDIVIGKSGIYAVTSQARFFAPAGWTYDSSTSVNYKFYVAFLLNGSPSLYTQSRGCWMMDTYSVFYVWWLDTWDRVNVWFLHTDTDDTFIVLPSINLYRLS